MWKVLNSCGTTADGDVEGTPTSQAGSAFLRSGKPSNKSGIILTTRYP